MRGKAELLLLAAIALVFWPALRGDYVYDDQTLILRNPALQGSDLWALVTELPFGAEYGYWRPLTALALWLGHTLGGAFGVHLLALMLHAGATLVAFRIAIRLLDNRAVALAAAMLFALHPVQVESVAWASAINDPLWVLFALLSLHSALRGREHAANSTPFTAAGFLLCALLSKENAIATAPIVVVAVLWAPDSARPRLSRLLITLFGAILVWWLLRAFAFGELSGGFLRAPQSPPLDSLRLLTAPVELLLRHLALLPWPAPLSPFRSMAPTVTNAAATAWLLGGALVVTLAWLGWRRPRYRLPLALLLLPIVPSLIGYRTIGSYPIADRYLYLSVLGAALLLAHTMPPRLRPVLWLLTALCGAASFVQTFVWQDQASLVAQGRRCAPEDPTLMVMAGDLALARAQSGDGDALRLAQQEYGNAEQRSLAQSPDVPHRALADARLGLAWCMLVAQGGQPGRDPERLIAAFQRAVDTAPEKAAVWVGLGVAYGIGGRSDDAERALQTALRLDGNHSEAWGNLGFLYLQTGQRSKALPALQNALRSNPDNQRARQLLDSLR